MITYKKSIRAFSKVTLRTRLLCWDDRRFYLEQIFYVNQEIYAHAYVEGSIRSPRGFLKPTEVFLDSGVKETSPEFPDAIQLWIAARVSVFHS